MELYAYDREFMELAVEEMLQSRSDHIAKPDPLVGAVIADRDSRLLGKTHRGGLRVGAHAEYTLIDRDLRDQDLEGASLYVTLEPCTSRGPGKTPCADRIIEARISRVFIGMVDPNPGVTGQGIAGLHKAAVEVGFFDADLRTTIQNANTSFIEHCEQLTGDEEEETALGESSAIENEVVRAASVEDLSKPHVKEYIDTRGMDLAVPSEQAWEYMARAGLVAQTADANRYRPTVAGLLLFGEHPADFLPQASVMLEAQRGNNMIYEEVSGPLAAVIGQVVGFLCQHMRQFTEITSLRRESIPEYPPAALREAIVNALVHRSYQEGVRVHVKLSMDRITIRSPGLSVYPITLSRLRAFDAPPISRNPRIANTLKLLGYMEERGSGIGRMRDQLVAAGVGEPVFNFDVGYFVLTIYGQGEGWENIRVSDELLTELDANARRIIEFVQHNGRITSQECAELLATSQRYAREVLRGLREAGLVEKRGASSSTYYVLAQT